MSSGSPSEHQPLLQVKTEARSEHPWLELPLVSMGTLLLIATRLNLTKILSQYDPEVGGAATNGEAPFSKPLFFVATYFVGQTLLLPFVGFPVHWAATMRTKVFLVVFLFASGSIMEFAAILFLPVSYVMLLRAACTLFVTALGSAFVTKRSSLDLNTSLALLLVFGGAVVATSAQIDAEGVWNASAALWTLVALLSAVVHAVEQMVGEDALQDVSTGNQQEHMLQYSALCGLIGTVGILGVMLIAQAVPGWDNGALENSMETVLMLTTSHWRMMLTASITISATFLALCSNYIIQQYGATTRESVLVFRIAAVWFLACAIHALFPASGFGEEWDTTTALWRVCGASLTLSGLVLYLHFRRQHTSLGADAESAKDRES